MNIPRNISRTHQFLFYLVFLLFPFWGQAQQTNYQNTVTKCYTGFAPSINSSTGTLLGFVNFTPADIPAGHRVSDVIVEIVWSKTNDGSCVYNGPDGADQSHVGFKLQGPTGTGGSRFLATSTVTANNVLPVSTASFTGIGNVVFDTIVFKQGAPSLLPAGMPVLGRDTVSPNNELLSFYYGKDPIGLWRVGGVDDPPGTGPPLCIHSYCITLVTCEVDRLEAICKTTTTVALDSSGLHLIGFSDVDSASDVSCRIKNITFSPASVSCSDVGTTIPVTMMIQDHLDSVSACVSQVLVEDQEAPILLGCAPSIYTTLYLGADGRDTFWSDSLTVTDNCGPIIKEVRNIFPSPWSSFVAFNCVVGVRRIRARATDASGNQVDCIINIEIIDTIRPSAVCGRDTAYLTTDPNGEITVPAVRLDGGSTDPCGGIANRWVGNQFDPPPVFTCADVGTHVLRLIVADNQGNLDTCNNAEVVVIDTIAPIAICRQDTIYLNASGVATTFAINIDGGSYDTCGIDSINVNGTDSVNFNCNHVNNTQPAILHVFDPNGNMDSCISWIVVRDTFAPLANCGTDTVYLNALGNAVVNAIDLNNNSIDVCTGTQLSFNINGSATMAFDCNTALSNPNAVTLTVSDTFNNASTCTAFVTVLDTITPVANCTNPTISLNSAGVATLTPALLSAGSTDNCAIVDSSINSVGTAFITYNCTAINTPQIANLLVADAAGNTSSCQATITVEDNLAPTAQCSNQLMVSLDATGMATLTPSSIDSNSTDNCTLVNYQINGSNSVLYDCSDLGVQTAVLTIQDSAGNTATCSSQIIVEDNNAPIVSCQNLTVALNNSGLVTITPDSVLVYPATNDNCGIANTSFSTGNSITFDCDSIGQRLVRVFVTDAYGNTSSCQTVVTIEDTLAPTANCRPVPFVVQLDNNGVGVVTPMDIDNGSTDLCQLDTLLVNGVDSFFFNCSNIGNSNTVTLSVQDSTGNQDFCTATVIVRDGNPPTAICKDTLLYLGATGVVTAFPSYIDGGSVDNCNITLSMNGTSSINFNCAQVGINPVQLIVTDAFGNTSQCPADITIEDTLAPVANCVNPGSIVVYLDSSCFATVPAATFNNGSTDNCNLPNGAFSIGGNLNVSFTAANLSNNPNPIILTVTDASNNTDTCQTTVIVQDTIRPSVICRTDTVQLSLLGTVTIVPSQVLASSSDNCNTGLSYTINNAASITFDCTNSGSNTVILTATDSSNNSSSCTALIEIEDLIAPNANCRPTTTLTLNAGATFGVLNPSIIDLGSTDNCTITTYNLNRDTFTCTDALSNPHTIQLLVSDAAGNLDSCTTQLTVEDDTDPIAACQTATVYLNNGIINVTPDSVLVAPTGDNCTFLSSAFAIYGSNIIYNCDSIGNHTVEVIVTDISGNTASCITTITVLDSVPPVANCITTTFTVQLDSTGNGYVYPQNIDNGSFDFCGISNMLVNGVDSFGFSCANIGTTAVTLSVLDSSGNQANCPANLIINDPINPIARCQDTTLYLNASGVVLVTPPILDAGSTDNCSFSTSINGAPSITFSCNQVGVNTVQLIVTDASGNINQCPANVTIVDTIAPVANCITPGLLTVYLDNTCFASIPASTINNGSNDNCGNNLTYSVNGLPNATFNATNVNNNPNSITLVVRDASGNVATCNTTILVVDTIRPVVNCQPDTLQLTGVNTILDPLMINAGSTDNCSVPTLTVNGQSLLTLDCTNLGTTVVSLIATDISGNQDSCSTTVFLEDVAPPTASCNGSTTIQLDPTTNQATLTTAMVDNGSFDNCTIISYGVSQSTFNCNDALTNPHPVSLYIIDQSGNQDSCTTQVFVEDTINPIAICQNDTLYYAGMPIVIAGNSLDGGSSDNCGIQSFVLSQDTFDCPNIGNNSVVMTITDLSGNSSTCLASVLLIDTTAAAVAGAFQVLCNNVDSTNLTALPVPASLTGTWLTTSGATVSNFNDPNALVSNLSVGDNIFYWVTSSATCARLSEDSITVRVIADSPDSAQAGMDLALCADTTTMLNAAVPTISTGQWSQSIGQANAGVVIVNDTAANSAIQGLQPGNTYVFVWELTNGLCGAYDRDTVLVIVDEIPSDQAMAGPDVTCSPDSINLAAIPSLFGIGRWSTLDGAVIADSTAINTLVKDFVGDTTLFIWSLSNGACVNYSADSMYVILDDIRPVAVWDSFNLVPDGIAQTINVIVNDSLPPNWDIMITQPMTVGRMISLNNGQFEIDINDAILNQYFIYEICNSDCPIVCDTALVTIAIQPPGDCYTPTAFTPNGDGKNDFFVIPCLENTTEKAALYIFNRWGNLVFETDNYVSDWDGTHRNQPLSNGTYFYILQIEGKKPQNGSIELKR
ncbi:MAG: gliding motility-associated C-terminal domain-containing protein [Aureispira sp.]